MGFQRTRIHGMNPRPPPSEIMPETEAAPMIGAKRTRYPSKPLAHLEISRNKPDAVKNIFRP